MNRRETIACLAVLSAAWPNIDIAEQTVNVWADALRLVNPEDGLAAAKTCVASEDWFPSVSKFRAAAQAAARRRAMESSAPALVSDTARPAPKESALDHIARMRAMLREEDVA